MLCATMQNITGMMSVAGLEAVSVYFFVSAALDGTLTVWGGASAATRGHVQTVQAHEKGVHVSMKTCHHCERTRYPVLSQGQVRASL